MTGSITAASAFALSNGDKIELHIFSVTGEALVVEITDPETLLAGLQRAIKNKSADEIRNAIMIKPEPAGVREAGWDL